MFLILNKYTQTRTGLQWKHNQFQLVHEGKSVNYQRSEHTFHSTQEKNHQKSFSKYCVFGKSIPTNWSPRDVSLWSGSIFAILVGKQGLGNRSVHVHAGPTHHGLFLLSALVCPFLAACQLLDSCSNSPRKCTATQVSFPWRIPNQETIAENQQFLGGSGI